MEMTTVGAFLDHFTGELQQATRKNALSSLAEAGREVDLAIQNAKNIWSEMLAGPMDGMDREGRDILDKMGLMALEVKKGASSLGTMASRVQKVIATLPFATHQPKITDVTPRYAAVTTGVHNVGVSFFGEFAFSLVEDFKPKLFVNGSEFASSENTNTTKLHFWISSEALLASSSGASASISPHFVSMQLIVPWVKTDLFGKAFIKKQAEYTILMGVLSPFPESPGTITLKYTIPFPRAITSPLRSTNETNMIYEGHRGPYQCTCESDGSEIHAHGINLKWGEKIAFEWASDDWSVELDSYEGSHEKLTKDKFQDKHISISTEGKWIILEVPDISEMSLPSTAVAARSFLEKLLSPPAPMIAGISESEVY